MRKPKETQTFVCYYRMTGTGECSRPLRVYLNEQNAITFCEQMNASRNSRQIERGVNYEYLMLSTIG